MMQISTYESSSSFNDSPTIISLSICTDNRLRTIILIAPKTAEFIQVISAFLHDLSQNQVCLNDLRIGLRLVINLINALLCDCEFIRCRENNLLGKREVKLIGFSL